MGGSFILIIVCMGTQKMAGGGGSLNHINFCSIFVLFNRGQTAYSSINLTSHNIHCETFNLLTSGVSVNG